MIELIAPAVAVVAAFVGGLIGYLCRGKIDDWYERRRIRLTHKLNVVEGMTKTFHQYTLEAYMPVLQAAGHLAVALVHEDRELSFYKFAIFLRHTNQTLTSFYLPYLPGEWVLSELYSKTSALMKVRNEGFLNEADYLLLGQGSLDERMEHFRTSICDGGSLVRIFHDYDRWIEKDPSEFRAHLRCWSETALFEVNEGHSDWYGEERMAASPGGLGPLQSLLEEAWQQASKTPPNHYFSTDTLRSLAGRYSLEGPWNKDK